ncbi:aminotransferase-like domain-containing protein [Humisphaera borealis]|uniref:PLP-dependent aminotransferase family protein n=1 Tax=Humisphaera borealis TaxID=2807512 RepID=A0A7M2WQ25_9BACT|nr:PLP-dependent aminotransferase family protein [Humisphaera borealis]QOV87499.1 PLP-dependent aminotransferase family protein [Humisphaera borealis]
MTEGSPIPLPLAWSDKAKRTKDSPISFLIAEAMRNPSLVNFAAGLVDPWSLPVEECLEITRRILSDVDRGRRALQYDTTLGLNDLRRQCLKHLASLEETPVEKLGYGPDEIVVTTGSQQALYLIGDILVNPGDIVIAANPSYFVYTGTLQSLGAHVMAVPMDQHGMDVDAVAKLLEKLDRSGEISRLKLIYCTSFYQNPTGLTLSADRRPRLLELVKKYSRTHRILLMEDAAYRELRYDGPVERSIKSYDTTNQFVASSYTFSKPFAPGIKLGYTVMPKDLAHAVIAQKGNHDFGSSSLNMHIAAEALADGSYLKHAEVLRGVYRRKRDLVLAALKKYFGRGGDGAGSPSDDLPDAEHPIHWTHTHGGLYVWLTLPPSIDTSRTGPLFGAAVDAGVIYVPGEYAFQPDEDGHVPQNHLRICYGSVHPDQIEPGIAKFSAVVKKLLAKTPRPVAQATGL